MNIHEIIVSEEDHALRLDKVLAQRVPDISRARVQALLQAGQVTLRGDVVVDASRKVQAGEVYALRVPPAVDATPVAQDIALDVVFEDDDVLVVNKPAGMVVHPAAGNHDGTLVNALLAHCGDGLSGIGGVRRPGIVHRLDKQTSGLLIVAKNDRAHQGLSAQLAARTLKRTYQAVVWGCPAPRQGDIVAAIGRSKTNRQKMAVMTAGGREAVTGYAVERIFGLYASLVTCRLQTGRTHQIRVHMAHIQHWLVGDPVYGRPHPQRFLKDRRAAGIVPDDVAVALLGFGRQALHAAQLEFMHPIRENRVSLAAPLPEDMCNLLNVLGNKV